jgi:ABC-2 type transport system permease protein
VTSQSAREYGPSAVGTDLRRFWELTIMMARTDFKLRYFGSALGYLWSLFRPLLFFGILFFFFTKILNVGRKDPHYGVYLLTGIVLWNYFGEATANSVQSLVAREGMLRKVRFPRLVIPLSVSLTSTFNLLMNMITVVVFTLANGLTPRWSWLEMIPIIFGFVVVGTGVGMLLSALYVRFRDIQPIWEVLLQAGYYLTPIMYLAGEYSSSNKLSFGGKTLETVMLLNPMGAMLTQTGHVVIGGSHYPSVVAAGGYAALFGAIAVTLGLFALGAWVFTHEAPRISENL